MENSIIITLCNEFKFSQKDLAEYLGVSAVTVHRYKEDESNIPDNVLPLMKMLLEHIIEIGFVLPGSIRFYESRFAAYPETVNAVKVLRNRMGLNQSQFASRIGVSTATISRYENQEAPSHVFRLAKEIIDIQAEMDYIELM